jgi:Nuclease-related domain
VRHDVDVGRGNADHVLLNPTGKVLLVETKTLAGQLSVERGQLTCRFVDAPEEVRRYDLESRMQRLVKLVEEKWERSTGRQAPRIRPLVVVWGRLPARSLRVGISRTFAVTL